MVLVFLALTVGAISVLWSLQNSINALKESVVEIREELLPMTDLQILLLRAAMPPNDYLIHGDTGERELFTQISQMVDTMFEHLLTPLLFTREEERLAIATVYEQWQRSRNLGEELLNLPYPPEDMHAAAQKMRRFDLSIGQAVNTLEQTHDVVHQEMLENLAQARSGQNRVFWIITLITVLGLLFAIFASRLLTGDLLDLENLSRGTSRLGKGDLAHRVSVNRQDELGRLAEAFNDMAAQLEANKTSLELLATHDSLTGLYNRHEFQRRIDEELKRFQRYGKRLSLILFDLDHFKKVNDNFGHHRGDQVLVSFAGIVKRIIRGSDIFARWGGEEFVLITPETTLQDATLLAERIRQTVADYEFVDVGKVTVSIGVSSARADDIVEKLFKRADDALYQAKQGGRNRVEQEAAIASPTEVMQDQSD